MDASIKQLLTYLNAPRRILNRRRSRLARYPSRWHFLYFWIRQQIEIGKNLRPWKTALGYFLKLALQYAGSFAFFVMKFLHHMSKFHTSSAAYSKLHYIECDSLPDRWLTSIFQFVWCHLRSCLSADACSALVTYDLIGPPHPGNHRIYLVGSTPWSECVYAITFDIAIPLFVHKMLLQNGFAACTNTKFVCEDLSCVYWRSSPCLNIVLPMYVCQTVKTAELTLEKRPWYDGWANSMIFRDMLLVIINYSLYDCGKTYISE